MEKLKNIIYLDYEKIYSLSSQLFQGIVFQSNEEKSISFIELESALNGTSVSDSNTQTEGKKLETFLNPHDYHYLKFEKALHLEDRIYSFNQDHGDFESLKNKSFVKIRAPVTLTDHEALRKTTNNFPELSYTLGLITSNDEFNAIQEQLKDATNTDKNILNNQKKQLIASLEEIRSKEKKQYFSEMSKLLEFAFGNDIEVQQVINKNLITSFFIKDFFKMPLDMFIRRYSRKTNIEFTILGLVTQHHRDVKAILPTVAGGDNDFRNAVMNITHSIFDLESTFNMPFEDEIFIEPIAMYAEV